MSDTILDHVDKIVVPGNVFQEPANEYWALVCFWKGMEFLYIQSKRCDDEAKRIFNPDGNLNFFGGANLPGIEHLPTALLTCSYHWYAVTACQYVRTIGAIAHRIDATRVKPLDYVNRVIPEVKTFRDKVAAHLSFSTQNEKDNDAERLMSVIPPLTFENDSFYVGSYIITLSGKLGSRTSGDIKGWSLSKVHETLRERYWPATAAERTSRT